MADTNETAAGAVPVGRIAGVVVLTGAVVALAVVAMTNKAPDVDPNAGQTQQVSNQSAPVEPDERADALAKADLSDSRITPELTQALTQGNQEEFNAAMDQLKQILAERETDRDANTADQDSRAAQKAAALARADQKVRNANTTPQGPATSPANPNAKINFKSMEVDFGDVYSTNPVPGTFEFTSAGTEDLIIEQVRTTCGCTSANAAELRNSRWEPGTGASIDFTFTPAQKAGLQSKNIIVITNSEENRTISLTLKANYIPAVKTSSQTATFGRVEAGNIGQARVVLESRDPNFQFKNFDLGDAAGDYTWSYTKLESVSEDYPSRGQLLIQTKPDATIGQINRVIGRMIVMSTEGDSAEQSELEFNVVLRGEIVGQLEVEPTFGRSPLAEPGTAFEHQIVVTSRKGEPFQITDVKLAQGEITDFEFEVSPVEGQNGSAYNVTVRGKAPQRAGGYMGKVEIYSDIENHGPMPFQFSGVLRASRQ
ncbi:MAG: DUF1573 domain-containing protein [Phycisphaerales bacterium]